MNEVTRFNTTTHKTKEIENHYYGNCKWRKYVLHPNGYIVITKYWKSKQISAMKATRS